MKDKRQRMAITWPYGIPPDPQIYAYLAAAAASYPYPLPNPASPYPSLPLPGLYQSPSSSAFSPIGHAHPGSQPMKPHMFEGLSPFGSSLGVPSSLDRLPTSSEASAMDSLSHRYKNGDSQGFSAISGALPSMTSLKSSCPCGLPTCSLTSGIHPSFPTSLPSSLPSSLHPALHPSLATSLPGFMPPSFFAKSDIAK